jgi:hypothetical protein
MTARAQDPGPIHPAMEYCTRKHSGYVPRSNGKGKEKEREKKGQPVQKPSLVGSFPKGIKIP